MKTLSTLCHAHICACVDSSTAQVENFLNTGPQFHRKFALDSFLLLLLWEDLLQRLICSGANLAQKGHSEHVQSLENRD